MKKKCYSLLRWPRLLQDSLNRRLLFSQTGSSSTKETITHHFFVSGIGQKAETVDAAVYRAAQKMLLKQKTCAKHSVSDCSVLLLLGTTRWKRVCVLLIINELPIDMGNSICTAH